MRIKYHYCIEGDDVILRKFFKGFSVNYQIYKRKEGENIYLFDLYEDQRAYDKFKLYFPVLSRTNSVRIIEYSKKEIEDSEWLIVESMIQKVSWKYDENSFEKSCPYKKMFIKAPYYRHYEQRNLLTAEKTVKWGNRHFLCS